MVSHPGAPAGTDRLRTLNEPRPVQVRANAAGVPQAITERGATLQVQTIEDRWVVEEEWWRVPIRRTYYRVRLSDQRMRTLCADTVDGTWFLQSY